MPWPRPLDPSRVALRYGLAIALYAAALAGRFALTGTLPPRGFPFLTFFPAVLLSAYVAGLGPGLLTAVLSILSAWYWFLGDSDSFTGLDQADVVALVFFAAILAIDCVVIHVMNRSLARVRETERRLREADARKDEFLAMLAHELRNPLAPIVNAVRVLRRSGPLGASGGSAVDMIDRQALQMRRLVDDLLDLSRINRGQIGIVPEPVELGRLVAQVAESLAPTLEQRGQALRLAHPAQPLRLTADPHRLTQVLENLLLNASKFSPDGGPIRVGVEATADGARLTVSDDGIGLEGDDLERVFEMFVQGTPSGNAPGPQGGLGIGLAMVRRLVELHGGRVRAESAGRGRGATFVVELPSRPPGRLPAT
ncbi:MAG TPA: HAMP domain-containing sensor histidine kinase [Burkholderiaceae bacterium]|nr:HAMP domain-containing sensor histidine kinase [Burkholderiaceae bacterium]